MDLAIATESGPQRVWATFRRGKDTKRVSMSKSLRFWTASLPLSPQIPRAPRLSGPPPGAPTAFRPRVAVSAAAAAASRAPSWQKPGPGQARWRRRPWETAARSPGPRLTLISRLGGYLPADARCPPRSPPECPVLSSSHARDGGRDTLSAGAPECPSRTPRRTGMEWAWCVPLVAGRRREHCTRGRP